MTTNDQRPNPIGDVKGRQLAVPAEAADDPKGVELARIWAAHGRQHVTIAVSAWEDPALWGIMLADFTRHLANAYAKSKGMSREEVLRRIRSTLEVEWSNPTDEVTGGFPE